MQFKDSGKLIEAGQNGSFFKSLFGKSPYKKISSMSDLEGNDLAKFKSIMKIGEDGLSEYSMADIKAKSSMLGFGDSLTNEITALAKDADFTAKATTGKLTFAKALEDGTISTEELGSALQKHLKETGSKSFNPLVKAAEQGTKEYQDKPITMNSYGLDNNTPLVEQFELSKNPISDMEVATKEYVDDNIGVSKKVITYDGASSSYTILISEGTVNDIKSDSTEEFIEGYKTFYSAIQLTRFMVSPYWRGLKTLLKRLSDARRVGIISDKLTYSVDQSFTEINYSYGKARDNKYFDCIVFINNGKKARLTCQLTYKADKTEELIMDDRLKYCSQAYTYLRSCRTVNMSINKEGSDETIKTILQVQSVDITGGTLIGQVLVNNDVYFYKLGLESGISDASWWTLTTKKLSDNFTPLKTQVTT